MYRDADLLLFKVISAMITLDNASNNNTMVEELAEELHLLTRIVIVFGKAFFPVGILNRLWSRSY